MDMSTTEILPLEDFRKLPKNEQKDLLLDWRNRFKTKDIQNKWGLDPNGFYKILHELGVPTRTRTTVPWDLPKPTATKLSDLPSYRQKIRTAGSPTSQTSANPDSGTPTTSSGTVSIDVEQTDARKNLSVTIQGVFDGKTLSAKLEGIARLLEHSSDKYSIEFRLKDSL